MSLWGGRFVGQTSDLMREFSSSIDLDSRLWQVDLKASRAHAQMLGLQKILDAGDVEAILSGLARIESEWLSGVWQAGADEEDIHGAIEARLTELIGEPAKRMHTARSRNDQVATDTRIYLDSMVAFIIEDLAALQKTLIEISEAHVQTVLPGCTHMQHAQPVSLAHHLMAYFWMFERDKERLTESRARIMSLPLGSAALAGTGFKIDRRQVANSLGFLKVAENSMDAVSDRDFVIEFLSSASLVMMHLSRLSEELILWSTPEYGFVELSDQVTTGSSIMPQKKNPDAPELIRGKTGRVYGALMGALTMMKSLPLAYNRDMQEDKVHLWSAVDTLIPCLKLMKEVLAGAEWKAEKMLSSLKGDFSNATDLADDLVNKGVSFREAHEVVGRVVLKCMDAGVALENVSVEFLRQLDSRFDQESVDKMPHAAVMGARSSDGGTAAEAVRIQIANAKAKL